MAMRKRKYKKGKMTKYVPFTLLKVLRKIKRNKKAAKAKCYKAINKNYKTLDWERKSFTKSEIENSVQDDYFKKFARMVMDKELRASQKGSKATYSKENVEFICFLKELAAREEEVFTKKVTKKRRKVVYESFYFDSLYMGKIKICNYPKTKAEKAKLVEEFLHTKEYIFDEDSPFFKSLKEIKWFI